MTSDELDTALREVPTSHSHVTKDLDEIEIIVWYELGRDDASLIVQFVERLTSLSYQGERSCSHDNVLGLRFSPT